MSKSMWQAGQDSLVLFTGCGQQGDCAGWHSGNSRQIGEWIDNNVRQAQHLYSLVANHPEFEAASNPPMSAICIRYHNANLTEADSKWLHAQVVETVEKSGKFWISTTELKGKTWFRINPVNFRTRTEHMEQLARSPGTGVPLGI